jgi:hypothetical protein
MPPQPTLAGFLIFIRNVMAISAAVLPDDSPYIPMAFAVALAIANPQMYIVGVPSTDAAGVPLNSGGFTIYALAVYNCAGHNLIEYAQDQPGAAGDPGLPFFQYQRASMKVNAFVSGVVQSSGDESTNVSLVVQDAAKDFTLSTLQYLKTPWGRTFLGMSQSFGPTTWGLT